MVNALLHFEQLNGFSLMWILSCLFKLPTCLNILSHLEQLNGFSSVCILFWVKYEDRGETNNQGKEVQDCWLYCCLNFKGQGFWPLTVSKTEIQKNLFFAINFSFLGMIWVPSTLLCLIEATWLLFGTCLLFGSCLFHKYYLDQ